MLIWFLVILLLLYIEYNWVYLLIANCPLFQAEKNLPDLQFKKTNSIRIA